MEAVSGGHILEFPATVVDSPEPLAALARQCYPDMAVEVEANADGWRVHLRSLAAFATVYDRDLTGVLAEIGVAIDGAMTWRRHGSVGPTTWLEALNPAWGLEGWSRWLEAGGTGRPLIVHIDPHDDLAVPSLVCEGEKHRFRGLIDDTVVDLRRPGTVAHAVECALIGMSSYVVPLLRAVPSDIVHLVPAASGQPELSPQPVRFKVGAMPWAADPNVKVLARTPDDDGDCTYRKTTDLSAVAATHQAGQPVFVDIDLAYFDLLPERRRASFTHAAPAGDVVDALAPLLPMVAVVTIACSPGFCRSRRWRPLLGVLRPGLGCRSDPA